MATFKNKTIQGNKYDLSHLEPFSFELLVGNDPFVIGVEFGCHCFTETLKWSHTPDFHYLHNGEKRAFSLERFNLSLLLPNLVTTIGNRSVYHSEQGNFFILRDVTARTSTAPYLVFFDVFRGKNSNTHVRILVRSAYLKPNMSRFAAPVKFTKLIRATANGQRLRLGPRQQIKRL